MILFISQIFNGYAYLKNYNVIYDNITNYIKKVVAYDTEMLKNNLDQIVNVGIQISVNKKLEDTAGFTFPLSPREKYHMRDLSADISGYMLANTDIKEIYLYYPSGDAVILRGNDYTPKDAYKFDEVGESEYYEEWYKSITSNDSYGFINVNTGRKNVVYFKYITNMPSFFGENPIILLEINNDSLLKIGGKNYFTYILDDNNTIIAELDSDKELSFENLDNTGDEIFIKNKNILYSNQIPNTDWKYVCVFEKEYWFTDAEGTRNTIFICFIASLLIGVFLVWYFVKQNGRPVENIIKQLNSHALDEYPGTNEYQYIAGAVERIIKENKKYENVIYKQEKYLIDNILGRMVRGNASQRETEALESLGVVFKYDKFAAVSFYIENFENIYFEEGDATDDTMNQAQFIVANVVNELLSNRFNTVFFNDNNFPICIINMKNGDEKERTAIKNIILEAWDLIVNKLNFTFVAGLSDIHETTEGIKAAYEECIEVLDYRFVRQECILDYKETVISDLNEYYYPIEKEELVLKSLESGDYEECKKQLDAIFKMNFENNNLSLEHARVLMMDIFCTFVKFVNRYAAVRDTNLIDCRGLLDGLNRCRKISEVKDLIYNTLEHFCDYAKANVVDERNDLVSEIIKFVNENYSDTQLSVAMIAEHFNVHPNYVSKLFKKHMGQGMLEYISVIRIQTAKELIENTDELFEYIAKQTGFSNIRTFYRVFSNFVGMTPGKYKALKKK